MTEHPAYRQIGLIGTGRVARALGLALAPHSAAPILVQGRNPDHAAAAVTAIGRAQAVALSSSLSSNCDLILLAVADDALPAVIADLTAMPLSATICHVSGRSGAALLDPLRAQGATTAAVHPAMTFTGDPAAEVARMRGARFAITGADAPSIAAARKLVVLLGGVAVEVAEAHRALYHAALCHAANHLVTLIAGASDALAAAGVAEPGALLAPLPARSRQVHWKPLVQVPALTNVSAPSLVMVHTAGVALLNVTSRPDVAVAFKLGVVPKFWAPGLAKVML